jgi:hypothetical protein
MPPEVERLQHEVGGSLRLRPRAAQPIDDLPVGPAAKALPREGSARAVAAESLQCLPVIRGHELSGVVGEWRTVDEAGDSSWVGVDPFNEAEHYVELPGDPAAKNPSVSRMRAYLVKVGDHPLIQLNDLALAGASALTSACTRGSARVRPARTPEDHAGEDLSITQAQRKVTRRSMLPTKSVCSTCSPPVVEGVVPMN